MIDRARHADGFRRGPRRRLADRLFALTEAELEVLNEDQRRLARYVRMGESLSDIARLENMSPDMIRARLDKLARALAGLP
jgi:DNA-binding CsgD family transcriptional regulator